MAEMPSIASVHPEDGLLAEEDVRVLAAAARTG
jgi:hypothetical protein